MIKNMDKPKLRVNIVSESAVSVQGHGVHTAYEEMAAALEARHDVEVVRGEFGARLDCDVIHLHTIGPRTFRKLFQKGPAKVVSAHVVPDSFVGSLVGARLWRPLATLYLRWFYNKADALIAVSDETAKELVNMGVRAPVTVLYNSIDTARYQAASPAERQAVRQQLGIPESAFAVIGAGQVQPRKRVDLFVQAAEVLPDVHFVWVGGIPFKHAAADYSAMKRLMETPLPNLHFPGMVDLEHMPQYYHAADLFWLPSIQETFGLVVVEAAASGLPVLLRDIPDYGQTFGAYAAMGDDATFVATIERLRSDEREYQASRQKAEQLAQAFDSKKVTADLVALYRNLVQ